MLEAEVGQVEAPVAETPETTATPFVNEDGTFAKDWTKALDPELQADKTLATFKSAKDLAKSYVNARSMIGKNKIAIPTESATEGEWNEYFKAGGRPDTAADYGLKSPEGLEEVFPKELLSAWQERFHKAGISKKAADMLIQEYAGDARKGLDGQKVEAQLAMQELQSGLDRDWGKAKDQNIHLGNLAIEEGVKGNQEFKARLTQKFGNDPDFIRFASNLGGKFAESKMIDPTIPTPADVQNQINDLMMTPAYTNREHPNHQSTVDKVQRLFQQKHGES